MQHLLELCVVAGGFVFLVRVGIWKVSWVSPEFVRVEFDHNSPGF